MVTVTFPITFNQWVALLRADARDADKIREIDALGYYVLRLFYDWGTEPTVAALMQKSSS